jgi:hypothetical protein
MYSKGKDIWLKGALSGILGLKGILKRKEIRLESALRRKEIGLKDVLSRR